jgi:protein-disulfide isomerase
VARRVQADVDDGIRAGVSGTPTFFLDGERMDVTTVQQLHASVDEAIAQN